MLSLIFLEVHLTDLSLLTMGSARTFSPWGATWPPGQNMAGNARFEIKLDRITKGALTIIKNLNTFIIMTSFWRHDVTCKRQQISTKTRNRSNFSKNWALRMVDPSFFMFLVLFMKNYLWMAKSVWKWWCQHFAFIFVNFSHYPGPRKYHSFAPRSLRCHVFLQKSSKLNQMKVFSPCRICPVEHVRTL